MENLVYAAQSLANYHYRQREEVLVYYRVFVRDGELSMAKDFRKLAHEHAQMYHKYIRLRALLESAHFTAKQAVSKVWNECF